jgi:hypothetical protein
MGAEKRLAERLMAGAIGSRMRQSQGRAQPRRSVRGHLGNGKTGSDHERRNGGNFRPIAYCAPAQRVPASQSRSRLHAAMFAASIGTN